MFKLMPEKVDAQYGQRLSGSIIFRGLLYNVILVSVLLAQVTPEAHDIRGKLSFL